MRSFDPEAARLEDFRVFCSEEVLDFQSCERELHGIFDLHHLGSNFGATAISSFSTVSATADTPAFLKL
jgi:hypothetical protein